MASRNAGLGLSGTSPKSPFQPNTDDPNSIPVAGENTAGLEHAHVDRRRNRSTLTAAELDVQPKVELRGTLAVGKAVGASMTTMERYNHWRAKQAAAGVAEQAVAKQAAPVVADADTEAAAEYLQVPVPAHDPPAQLHVRKSEADEFLAGRTRVTVELNDGIFTLPAVSVRQSTYCVVVLVPLSPDQSIFVPKPGTQLTLSHKDDRLKVYFPGAYVEYPELGVAVMAFIKAEN